MTSLLDDKLAPITSEFGFVQAPAKVIAEWWLEWETRLQADRGVSVTAKQVSHGARIFELYGGQQPDFTNCVRAISVANDGGRWRMDLTGTPLPAENRSWFTPKRVKDRFLAQWRDGET